MKKLIFGIFICLGLIFTMSHNANAVQLSYNLNDYELLYSAAQPKFNVLFNNVAYNNNQTRLLLPYSANEQFINNIRTSDSFTYKAGDIFEFYISIGTVQNYQLGGGTLSIHEGTGTYPTEFLSVLSIEQVSLAETPFMSISSSTNTYDEVNSVWGFASAKVHYIYKVALIAMGDYTSSIGLSNPLNDYIFRFYQQINNNSDPTVGITFNYLKHYRRGQSKQDEAADKEMESAENIENQTPPSSSETGDGAQATNLIGAFSGFVSALGSLSATNCNLTLNFPSFAGGTRVVNVCQNKDKAGNIISVFSSLTLIIFYVPLAIRLLTMIYNEIRSFTNG